jgi:shikimate kinase
MFYLASSIGILYERIRFDSNRPNAFDRSLEDLKSLFESRKPQYEKANYEIVTENLTPSDVCMEIINCLNYVKGGDSSNK